MGGSGTGSTLFGSKPSGGASFSFGQNSTGNAQQAAQQPVGSSTGFGFGNNQPGTQNTGLFTGGQQSNVKAGSPFGNSTTSGAAANTGTGLFGNNPGSTNNNSSLLGQQSATGGGLFGNKKPTNGLYGSSNQTSQTSQNNSGGGLFNNSQNNQTAPGGGLFGNNNQRNAGGGGLFGNTNQSTTGASGGGGLFGNANQSTAGTSGGGGLFGNANQTTANTSTGGGLFGNTNQNSTGASSGGGLFGNTGQNSGSLFNQAGNNTNNSLFGNSNTGVSTGGGLFGNQSGSLGNQQTSSTATTGGLFGSKPQNTTGGGLFGQGNTASGLFNQTNGQSEAQSQQGKFGANFSTSTQPLFAWSNSQPNQSVSQQQQQQQLQQQQLQQQQNQLFQQPQQLHLQQQTNYPLQIQEQVIKCKESWDPTSSNTKLRGFVYNKINENEAMLYHKPPYVSQEEWDNVSDKKPSASFTPAEILGFEGLNQRTQLQRENVAQARLILNQILEKFTQLQQKHELDTAARILKARSRNIQIEKRILRVGTQLAILKSRGLPLSVSEEKMWSQFQSLLQRGNDPAGLGKTNELWARLAVLKERAKNISDQLNSTLVVVSENGGALSNSIQNEEENNTKRADEEVEKRIDKVVETLSSQQRGISYLSSVLEKDHKTVDRILNNRSSR